MTPPSALLWSYLGGGLAYLIPLALLFVVLSGLDEEDGRSAALLFPAVMALAALAYAAVGFAFEFGGVGLLDPRHGFSALVWEWSPLPEMWGEFWGVMGFAGWFLAEGIATAEAVGLLVGHLAWAVTAAWLVAVPLRRRRGALAPLVMALVVAGIVEPLAGNWVHGGGWLGRLGASLGLGQGFVDFAGSGVVGIVGGSAGIAVLIAFQVRRDPTRVGKLAPVSWPVLAALGSVLFVVGSLGWALHNPLYAPETLPMARVVANSLLGFAGGAAVPALYVWFVAGRWHPHLTFAGGWAGWLAVLAGLPYLPPPTALVLGVLAGGILPFGVYLVREVARLDDPAGVLTASWIGGMTGLVGVGLFADGRYALPWMDTPGGVYGVLAGGTWQADALPQLYAQLLGLAALTVWGFLAGSGVGVFLAALSYAARRWETISPQLTVTSSRQADGPAPTVLHGGNNSPDEPGSSQGLSDDSPSETG